ncbi:B-block binding subunit of TFIIIC [Penicillium chermesinum]|uniref:B-block binding subunit of TFIIIC n=1 Tax=Penicillium chermesinum TaxID=63820 RepID=A0A9W9P7R9_9EURO|nr:B-block binding subunit of TFIIIC [Penicillium chermesinum]KAJ5239265.1 B-block binding subunit of TFIIIC [Penicillium chermesinum]
MVRSLQGLVNFVLNEVALCGSQGATLSDFLQAIDDYYRPAHDQDQHSHQNVDRRFQGKVWSWLTRNPEVSVGKNKEFNHLTLQDLEKLQAEVPESAATDEPEENGQDPGISDQLPPVPIPSAPEVRMFVSEKRTWLAVTGHEPDETRVPSSEYGLLSIIASAKADGIPQTELIRRSGQDKRSVPKRTDALQRKGYIEKRNIQVRGSRTSLCIARRFANAATEEQDDSTGEKRVMMDFDSFTDNLFKTLKEFRLISRNDLKEALGFEDLWHWRILSRALRKFERIGVLQRVRAKSQYSRYHPCVRLLRDPTPLDLEMFHEYSRDALSRSMAGEADMEDDEDLGPGGSANQGDQSENQTVIQEKGHVVGGGIFEIVDKAGTAGITNLQLNRALYGHFYKRPAEALVSRLVNCWQISQPPQLRHFSIVRDTDVQKTILYYVHYSFRHFEKRVENGTAFWEAVVCSSDKVKPSGPPIPAIDAPVDLDEHGLPRTLPFGLQKNGNVSLFEGLAVCKPTDYSLTRKDPMPFLKPDGSYCIASGSKPPPGCTQYLSIKPHGVGRPKGSLNKQPRAPKRKRMYSIEPTATSPEAGDVAVATPEVEEGGECTRVRDSEATIPARKKGKWAHIAHLPQKERFEAMGMDESWTEYSALVMDKPTPGVIAIFKSPKLAELPWFTSDEDNPSGDEREAQMPDRDVMSDAPRIESTAAPRRRSVSKRPVSPGSSGTGAEAEGRLVQNQRRKSVPEMTETPDSTDAPTTSKRRGGARTAKAAANAAATDSQASVSLRLATSPQPSSPANGKSARTHSLDEPDEGSNKRRRVKPSMNPAASLAGKGDASQLMPPPPPKADTPKQKSPSVRGIPSIGRKPAKRASSASTRPHGLTERSGTVNILRRNIVMEIVEAAGGAYPAGNEIWYPFTSKWSELNYKERPDTRTIRVAVKQLVDSGKLRRMTFSGKDPKGVMVTKDLLLKPDMSTDDPIVKEMQEKLLSYDRVDASHIFSPQVPTSAPMRKNTRHADSPLKGGQIKKVLPVISHATVQIQRKPAFVLIEEKRKAQRLERELQKRLAMEMEGYAIFEAQGSGVRRLMSLNRPIGMGLNTWRYQDNPAISRRLNKTMTTIGPMAMMMNPDQVFDPTNGTFGTRAVMSEKRKGKKAKFFTSSDPEAAMDDLLGLIETIHGKAQPNSSNPEDAAAERNYTFFQTVDKVSKWEVFYEDVFNADLNGMPFIDLTVDPRCFQAAPIEPRSRFYASGKYRTILPANATYGGQFEFSANIQTSDGYQIQESWPAPRRPRVLATLPDSTIRKFMVAIVVVRTLAGGNEGKTVEWELVQKAFPKADLEFVQVHGKSIIARNRMEILKMQRDFQELFLEAYEKDAVPPIDYDDLPGYDWSTVVEWATIELEFSTSEKAPTLPATRKQFDSVFQLREDVTDVSHELFFTGTGTTILNKRHLMTRIPFVVEQPRKPVPQQKQNVANLEVAKTWVRANVLTPDDRTNKGRPIPGRNYTTHDAFTRALERRGAIDSEQLRQAAAFKANVLDPAFQKGETIKISYHASDGDSLAVEELIAHNRVEVVPVDPPRLKFGLTDGGYLTRQMDKNRLRFDLEVHPLPTYYWGNPIQEAVSNTPPPVPQADRKIPLWFDIHGCLLREMWEKCVALVIGAVLLRPGVDAQNIAAMIKPTLSAWEISLLLEEWMVKVGAVRRCGEGDEARWTTTESWWYVLAGG